MSYFFEDNSEQNQIYENEFFYSLGLEFPLSKKVYSHKSKVSYSKEKKIWFIRYKTGNDYFYLFGYNYGSDKQLDTKDPLLIIKFNLFNAPNVGNGHFARDNVGDEVRAVMNIRYNNYHSLHKNTETLKSITPLIVDSDNYLDLGNIRDSKELCENIELLLDEIESIFFFDRYLTRIENNTPLKKDSKIKKQIVATVEIEKEENSISENTNPLIEHPSEISNCDFCGSEILNNDPFKICKACRIRIFNYIDSLCVYFKINTKIPFEDFLHKAQEHNFNRKDVDEITATLKKYSCFHKIDEKYYIEYNSELRDFIDKYSGKTKNKQYDIENKIILLKNEIGLNIPFDIPYLKETLNFKNTEISKMIKYLDEKNAIIQDGEYYILVDKSNEINGINDSIIDDGIKLENGVTEDKPTIDINPVETSDEKPTNELKPNNTKNKTDEEIFYELYEKVLTFRRNNVQLKEIASKLEITENRLNIWIKKGQKGQNPYKLLYDGIKKIEEEPVSKINDYTWKKIIEYIKNGGTSVFEAAKIANIPYPLLQLHLNKGQEGIEGYKKYYEEYQNALNSNTQDEIKTHNRCQICNVILSDETKIICDNCESKKKFAIDLKILMEKLKNKTNFTTENLIIYYNDDEISKLINNLKKYDLVLENKTLHIFYLKKENIKEFLDKYFDAENSDYKIKSESGEKEIIEIIKDEDENKIEESNATNSSKTKIITSIKKRIISKSYIKLEFTGELPNNEIDSSIMELLNEFKAINRELKLIPINENESKITFNLIITNDNLTTPNIEILRKYNWHFKN